MSATIRISATTESALAGRGLALARVADCLTREVAAAATRGFEGYVVPLAFTPESYERRFRLEHLDPFASRVLRHHGEPAGAILIARRGWTSRVAAIGVAPEHRGHGVGAMLLELAADEARARGDRRLILEVIEQNPRAVALYERTGFHRARRMVGWRMEVDAVRALAAGGDAADLDDADPAALARLAAREGEQDLPWALAPETLAGVAAPARAYGLDGRAFVLVADPAATPLVVSALLVRAGDRGQGWGRRLLRSLARGFPDRPWQISPVVPETLAPGFFHRTGWTPHPVSQFEMRRPL